MKVVKNDCYGGFSLSSTAIIEYCKRKGIAIEQFNGSEIERNDKDLVFVVEMLKSNANGDLAELVVVDIPDGIDFEITDYDGIETIREKHRTW